MAYLRANGIRHAYGEHVVLDDVTFAVDAGRALALTGSNGTGKSTLLRCLVGAEKPAAGTVHVGDRSLSDTDPAIRRDLVTVFDDIDFFPDLTVAEHLDLLARAHGVGDVEEVVDSVLYELGLDRTSDQFPSTLSSGQRHRLALATALVRPRRLLLLDEPEQRLDDAGRTWLAGRLEAEKADGVTIVFASHSRELVDAVADSELSLEPA